MVMFLGLRRKQERKQFPRRTAHNNVSGLCWVTRSWCLERNMAAEFFKCNFWALWAPQILCNIAPLCPRKRQTTHTKTIYCRWLNVMMYQPLFHHFSPSLPTYWNLLSLMLNNTWMRQGQNLITVIGLNVPTYHNMDFRISPVSIWFFVFNHYVCFLCPVAAIILSALRDH